MKRAYGSTMADLFPFDRKDFWDCCRGVALVDETKMFRAIKNKCYRCRGVASINFVATGFNPL
jgi:hypothetical protein